MNVTFDSRSHRDKRDKRRAMIAVALFLVLLTVMTVRLFVRKTPQSIAEATMPDGTTVALRSVLFNPQSEFDVGVPTLGVVTPLSARDTILQRVNQPLVRFALSRHDAKTGDYLDFSWFSHIELTDRWGATVRSHFGRFDQVRTRVGYQQRGTSASIGKPIAQRDGYRLAIVYMHRFESDSAVVDLRVVNRAGTVVATLPLPVPAKFQTEHNRPDCQWQSTIRDTTVRVDSMKMVGGGHTFHAVEFLNEPRSTQVIPFWSMTRLPIPRSGETRA